MSIQLSNIFDFRCAIFLILVEQYFRFPMSNIFGERVKLRIESNECYALCVIVYMRRQAHFSSGLPDISSASHRHISSMRCMHIELAKRASRVFAEAPCTSAKTYFISSKSASPTVRLCAIRPPLCGVRILRTSACILRRCGGSFRSLR